MSIGPILNDNDKMREVAKETVYLRLEHDVKNCKPLVNGWHIDTWEHDWAAKFIEGYESAMRGESLRHYASECFKRGFNSYQEIIK